MSHEPYPKTSLSTPLGPLERPLTYSDVYRRYFTGLKMQSCIDESMRDTGRLISEDAMNRLRTGDYANPGTFGVQPSQNESQV